MKNKFFKVFSILCICLALGSVFSFTSKEKVHAEELVKSQVIVNGESHVTLTADIVKVSVTIFETNENLNKAKDDAFDKFSNAKQKLVELGINDTDIILKYFTTYSSYDYQTKNIDCYNSNITFEYTVDSDGVKKSIDSLTDIGISNIGSIDYMVKNYEEEYNKLLKSAIDNALDKAKIMLDKQNVTVKKIIEQETYNFCSTYKASLESVVDDSFENQVQLTARVKVIVE